MLGWGPYLARHVGQGEALATSPPSNSGTTRTMEGPTEFYYHRADGTRERHPLNPNHNQSGKAAHAAAKAGGAGPPPGFFDLRQRRRPADAAAVAAPCPGLFPTSGTAGVARRMKKKRCTKF